MALKKMELKDCVGKKIHIDEFKAKMGDDADIIVLSFKSTYKDQATDLVNFLEKGYDWVLDADVSAGELGEGGYVVFVEMLRRPSVPEKIMKMLHDIENLTGNEPNSYELKYAKEVEYTPLSIETLSAKIPLDPRKYRRLNKTVDDVELENMQMSAGLAPKTEAVTDPELKAFINLSK